MRHTIAYVLNIIHIVEPVYEREQLGLISIPCPEWMVYVITSFSDSLSGLAFLTNLHRNSTILACQYIEPSGGRTETLKMFRNTRQMSGSDGENTQIANFECGDIHGVVLTSMLPCLNQIHKEGAPYIRFVIHSCSATEIAFNLWKASREGTSSPLFLVFQDLFFELGMGSGCGVKRLSSIYIWVTVRTYLWTCIWNMWVACVR